MMTEANEAREETTLAEVYRRCLEGTFYEDHDWAAGPALRCLRRAAQVSQDVEPAADLDALEATVHECANTPSFDGWLNASKRLIADVPAVIAELRAARHAVSQDVPAPAAGVREAALDEYRKAWNAVAEDNNRMREALTDLLPDRLCGEGWDLPEAEKVPIVVTFGALKRARAALKPTGAA